MSIYNFGGGIRVPASGGSIYMTTPNAQLMLTGVGLSVFNNEGVIDVTLTCPLLVPEKVTVAQLVMVGRVTQGQIVASIIGVPWNLPLQVQTYASVGLGPTIPLETPFQQKAVTNVPPGELVIDRINCYLLQARFTCDTAVSDANPLSLFYFEIYWN